MQSVPTDRMGSAARGWSSARIATWLTGGQGRPAALVLVVLLAAFQVFLGERSWSRVRNTVFDAYQWLFPRQVTRYPVVIVDIDDASLQELGRWPWPRTRLARLIEATHRLGALAIGLDIIMPEADTLAPDMLLAEWPEVPPIVRDELAKLPSNDTILAQTLGRTPSVVGRAGLMDSEPKNTPTVGQTSVLIQEDTPTSSVQAYAGHLTNIPEIEAAAFGRGYLNALPDADGVMRLMPLVVTVQGRVAPTLALELLRVASGAQWYSVHGSHSGIHGVHIGASFIPTDPDGRIRVYFSPSDPERYVSARAILNGEIAARAFANQVAIIGVTGVGTSDVVVTPVAPRMYGVEVQAQVVENILAGTRLQRPSVIVWLELLTFFVPAVLLIIWLPRWQPGYSVVVFLGVAIIVLAGSCASFVLAKALFDPSFSIVANALILGGLLIVGFTVERQEQVFLRKTFSIYLSPELIEEMVQTKTEPKLGGSAGIRTAYFTDIASFSSFSEVLTATQLVELLNEYLTTMTDILLAAGGTLDKYEGDAIVAFFGAPMFQQDHAARALRTALAMQQQLTHLREKWRSEGEKWPALVQQMRMRIGIHSGEIVTGNMGSAMRMNYTMMGDTVNTAARLEAAAKHYGIYIQCTTDTLNLAGPDDFAWRRIDSVRVVGKSAAVETVEVMALKGQLTQDQRQMCALYHQGLELYRQRQWDAAKVQLAQSEELEEVFPGRPTNPSRVYIERCHVFEANPPGADWDGVWALMSK